jgi:hypothetical protein
MATDAEPPIRDQLIEARQMIIAQLEEMDFRLSPRAFQRLAGGLPDRHGIVAELEEQLREIDAILDTKDPPSA